MYSIRCIRVGEVNQPSIYTSVVGWKSDSLYVYKFGLLSVRDDFTLLEKELLIGSCVLL